MQANKETKQFDYNKQNLNLSQRNGSITLN